MKVISAIVGLVLLGASFTLAYLSSSNAEQMIQNQDKIVTQYIEKSNTALEEENFSEAIKFVKLAIVADPKSKEAFKTYEMILETKYKPADDDEVEGETPVSHQPSAEQEEEVEMGC